MTSLPKGTDISVQERRYPTTPASMRSFLNAFFARHFFQVQDSILQPEAFERFCNLLRKGEVNIVDIGSGPAVASLAVLDLINAINESGYRVRSNVNIVQNDSSAVCLQSSTNMLSAFRRRTGGVCVIRDPICIDVPFPDSLTQIRRISSFIGRYDLCFVSYVLDAFKKEMTHGEIGLRIKELLGCCADNGLCIILQDKFRESLIRQAGRLQGASVHKARLTQKVYDNENSNAEQLYTYFRTTVMLGSESEDHGVLTRFCLQKKALMRCF
ncbi:MAG: hypothetical protein JW936_05690 [Sedimentisphaerales bacterium]|nr:hypothetical protein [Sedimentisphaerales bacterium]